MLITVEQNINKGVFIIVYKMGQQKAGFSKRIWYPSIV